MGNWRNHPLHRKFRQNNSPWWVPREYDHEPLTEFWQDGIPTWEKKFCTEIGSIPWRKIVDTKKYMCSHNNVLNWNDSAGEEAFQNAKSRYWAEFNGLNPGISLPEPNLYIDKVNWDSTIDFRLIEELDMAYFAPQEEEEKNMKVGRENKKPRKWDPQQRDSVNPMSEDNPWESKGQGWNKAQCNGDEKDNPWGDCVPHSSGWDNVRRLHVSGNNPWEQGNHSSTGVLTKDKGWGEYSENNMWGRNLKESYNNWWDGNYGRHVGLEPERDRSWHDNGKSKKGWKEWNSNKNWGDLDFERSGGWGGRRKGYEKQEGYCQYDYQIGDYQRNGNTRKRVSFYV